MPGRPRDLTFNDLDWAAFAIAAAERYPSRAAAARTVIGDWLTRNNWASGSPGTIPDSILPELARTQASTAGLHRAIRFPDTEWEALTAAAAAARVPYTIMARAIIRAWMPADARDRARTAPGPFPAGVTPMAIAVMRVFLTDPSRPWYGRELAAEAGVKKVTVYPILRRLEERGWLTGEQTAPRQPGTGWRPPRVMYTLTPAGQEEARDLLAAIPG